MLGAGELTLFFPLMCSQVCDAAFLSREQTLRARMRHDSGPVALRVFCSQKHFKLDAFFWRRHPSHPPKQFPLHFAASSGESEQTVAMTMVFVLTSCLFITPLCLKPPEEHRGRVHEVTSLIYTIMDHICIYKTFYYCCHFLFIKRVHVVQDFKNVLTVKKKKITER